MRALLLIGGAAFELVGVLAIAVPDWLPWLRRPAAWISRHWWLALNRLRRLFGRTPHTVTASVAIGGAVAGGGRVSGLVEPGDEASLEDTMRFLVTRATEAQREINDLTDRVATLERETLRRLLELRIHSETHTATELRKALTADRPTRVLGTAFLVIGLALTTIGNFVR